MQSKILCISIWPLHLSGVCQSSSYCCLSLHITQLMVLGYFFPCVSVFESPTVTWGQCTLSKRFFNGLQVCHMSRYSLVEQKCLFDYNIQSNFGHLHNFDFLTQYISDLLISGERRVESRHQGLSGASSSPFWFLLLWNRIPKPARPYLRPSSWPSVDWTKSRPVLNWPKWVCFSHSEVGMDREIKKETEKLS